MSRTIAITLAPGFWGAPLEDFESAAADYRSNSDIVSWTETTPDSQVNVLRHTPNWVTWSALDNKRGECAIQADKDQFKVRLVGTRVHRLTTFRFYAGTTLRPAVRARVLHLEDRLTGKHLFVVAIHMPASVEGPAGLRGTRARVNSYRDCLKNLRLLLDSVQEQHPDAAIAVCADWNLNHKRIWVRVFLRRKLGLRFRWRIWHKVGGTHGSRLIDAIWVHNCRVVSVRARKKRPGFDHKAVRAVIQM